MIYTQTDNIFFTVPEFAEMCIRRVEDQIQQKLKCISEHIDHRF